MSAGWVWRQPAHPAGTFGALICTDAASRCRPDAVARGVPKTMKKLIAALVLATSFAALADDAAKTDAPKSAKKAKKAKKSTKEAPAGGAAAEPAPAK